MSTVLAENYMENRNHERIKHRANIRVMTSPDHELELEMRDFSESGLYLFCDDTSIVSKGSIVEVQTLEIPDAPILTAEVVRIEEHKGFAVTFSNIS